MVAMWGIEAGDGEVFDQQARSDSREMVKVFVGDVGTLMAQAEE